MEMPMKRLFKRKTSGKRGQSLVELSMILLVLALLVAGVVEYGMLLNNYLHVVDGAREAARLTSNAIPFYQDPTTRIYYPDVANQEFFIQTVYEAVAVMSPLSLNPSRGDDVVVTVYSMSNGYTPPLGVENPERFPREGPWSLCEHAGEVKDYIDAKGLLYPPSMGQSWAGCVKHASSISGGDVLSHMNIDAPSNGALVVEIFYNYPQVLKLPVFTTLVPDPIPVYAFTVMPISSAEPTPTP